jgi:hypothetical protein
VIVADPWSITMTSVANGRYMGMAGIILVSSGLLAASLIPSKVDVFYIAVGLLAGNLNAALSTEFQHGEGMFFQIQCGRSIATHHYTSNIF